MNEHRLTWLVRDTCVSSNWRAADFYHNQNKTYFRPENRAIFAIIWAVASFFWLSIQLLMCEI